MTLVLHLMQYPIENYSGNQQNCPKLFRRPGFSAAPSVVQQTVTLLILNYKKETFLEKLASKELHSYFTLSLKRVAFLFHFVPLFQITQLIAVLIRNADQKKWQGYHFAALVEMLKKVDKNTLIDIWDQCYDDDHFRCVCGSIKTLHKNRNPIPLNLLVFYIITVNVKCWTHKHTT